MSSISSAIQKSILSLLLSRLPIYLDEKDESNISLSSGIHLTNITLDEEKLESQMPNHVTFHVRSAKVGQLDIQVGTDGIKAQVKNMNIVVSPKLDFNQDSNETVDEVMQSVIDLMDAVTVRSLNTDEIEKEYFDDILEDEENVQQDELIKSMIQSNTISTNHKNGKESWTGYVLSYIMSRVKINIEDIKIKIIADPLILHLTTDIIEIETEKTQRKCTIEGIKIGIPDSTINSEDQVQSNDDSLEEEASDESDYDDNLMASSFLAESRDQIPQSLMDSANYKSGTMYMTTTSGGYFDAPSHFSDTPVAADNAFGVGNNLILFIEHASFIMSTSKNLEIEISTINGSIKHSPEVFSSLLSVLIQLNKNTSVPTPINKKVSKSPNTSKFNLNDFNIGEINISFFSDIKPNGDFDSPERICLKLKELSVQQKGDLFYQGVLMRFGIFEGGKSILNFQNEKNTHVDFKFEVQSVGILRTISVICSNSLIFDVSMEQIKQILGLYYRFQPVMDQLGVLNDSKSNFGRPPFSLNKKRGILKQPPPSKVNNEIAFNLSGIHGQVNFDNGKGYLQFDSTGLVFNSSKKFDLGGLEVVYNENDMSCKLLSVSEISLREFIEAPQTVRSYDNNTKRHINLRAKNIMDIGLINSSVPYSVLQTLVGISKDFQSILSIDKDHKINADAKVQFKKNSHSKISSSLLLRTQILDLHIIIKRMNFEFLDIKPEFGNIKIQIDNACLSKNTDGLKNGFIEEVSIDRIHQGTVEPFIKRANLSDKSPMVIFKLQPGTPSIDLINWEIDYYGQWLKIFDETGVDKFEPMIPRNLDIDAILKEKIQKRLKFDLFVSLTDFVIGMTPVNLSSKALIVFKKATCDLGSYNDKSLVCQMNGDYASVYLIDDKKNIQVNKTERLWDLKRCLKTQGFVQIGKIGILNMKLNFNTIKSIIRMKGKGLQHLLSLQLNVDEVEFSICSDSLQCFINLLKDLKQPILFSLDDKYKFNLNEPIDVFKDIDDNMFSLGKLSSKGSIEVKDLNKGNNEQEEEESSENELSIVDDYYDSKLGKNAPANNNPLTIIPINFYIGISRINVLLYDGYDWKETRNQISEAVLRVSNKAQEMENDDSTNEEGDCQSFLVEETLYQSIYVGMHTSGNTTDFVKNINDQIGHQQSEPPQKITVELGKSKTRPLQLKRSKNHKIAIQIDDLDVDLMVMSNNEPHIGAERPILFEEYGVEAVQKVTIGVKRFQVIDNVPTSNWNMFMGYLREVGDIEIGKEMIHIDIEINRPISRLAALEMIMKVQVLPLRLHIDQDTLDFLLRFGEFKDQRFLPPVLDNDELYIQKFSINAIQLKLDYKPKVIDYAGIRSGHTGEFVNLFVLDESRMTLNKLTLFGTYGFQRLNKLLNGYWSPDIKKNQLGGVLSGLAFMRSIVNIGQGVEQLVSEPIREYQREGKLVRGVHKGVMKFGKTTGGEVLKFGAKLATGTQVILENTEELLGGGGPIRMNNIKERDDGFTTDDNDLIESEGEEEEELETINTGEVSGSTDPVRVLSLYSQQPGTLSEGLHAAYGSISRNMSTMRLAIVDAGDRAGRSTTFSGAVVEVMRATPVVVMRPLIATSEAISKTLLGGVNGLDPEQKRRVEEKYK